MVAIGVNESARSTVVTAMAETRPPTMGASASNRRSSICERSYWTDTTAIVMDVLRRPVVWDGTCFVAFAD
jgi:hypothetical protein